MGDLLGDVGRLDALGGEAAPPGWEAKLAAALAS
jgi:hypothetical protein